MVIKFCCQWLRDSTRLSAIPYGYLFSLAQGMPVTRLYLWRLKLMCSSHLHMRPWVRAEAPGIPCALYCGGTSCCKTRAPRAAGRRKHVVRQDVVARSASDEAILKDGLHDDWIASPALAMTLEKLTSRTLPEQHC